MTKFIFILFVIASWFGSANAQPNQHAKKFLDEYGKYKEALEARYRKYSLDCDFISPTKDGLKQVTKCHFESDGVRYISKTNGSIYLNQDGKIVNSDDSKSLVIGNTRYDATIVVSNDQYLLKKVKTRNDYVSNIAYDNFGLDRFPYFNHALDATYYDIVKATTFVATSAGPVKYRDFDCYEISGNNSKSMPGGKTLSEQYTFYFLQSAGWICLGYKSHQLNEKDYFEDRYQYKNYTELMPVIAGRELWYRPTSGKEVRRINVEYHNVEVGPVLTDAQCSLTAFGLPEPIGAEVPQGRPTYFWLLAVAGFLGLVAVLLRSVVRRPRSTGPSQ